MGWWPGSWGVFVRILPIHETGTFATVVRPFLQLPGGWSQLALGFLVALFSRHDLLPSPLQRAELILGLYKCNYSLTVKELKLHSAL